MWSLVPRDSDLRMTALARASSNCINYRSIHSSESMLHKVYESKYPFKINAGRGSEGACRQEEMIGGKPPVVK
jgi:hypothetical protein